MDPELTRRVVKALRQAQRDARQNVDAEEAGELVQLLTAPEAVPIPIEVPEQPTETKE